MFNIINNADLNTPAMNTQLYIETSTTSPPDLHSSLEELASSAPRLKSTLPNGVIYLEVPGESNTISPVTAKGGSVDCDPHIPWLLLQSPPRLLGWG